MAVMCARNSSPSIPGIFTSVMMHMASGEAGPCQRGFRGGEDLRLPPAKAEHLPDGVPRGLVIIYHDDCRAFLPCHQFPPPIAFRRAPGRRMRNVAPVPGAPAASISPLWSLMMAREMESPRPWPPLRVV